MSLMSHFWDTVYIKQAVNRNHLLLVLLGIETGNRKLGLFLSTYMFKT